MGEVEGSLLLVTLSWLCPTLLCRAAEAVLQGRADSILAYHQQNVPRAKLDQVSVSPGLSLSSCRPPKCHPPRNRYP